MVYVITFGKAIFLFIIGLTAFRLMGSQAVGRLNDFDLVVVIAIGTLIGAPLVDEELNLLIAVTAIFGLVFAQQFVSWFALKSDQFENLVVGKPIKLIDNGQIILKGLRKAKLTRRGLTQEMRSNGIANEEEVETAYMEPSGDVSFIRKEQLK